MKKVICAVLVVVAVAGLIIGFRSQYPSGVTMDEINVTDYVDPVEEALSMKDELEWEAEELLDPYSEVNQAMLAAHERGDHRYCEGTTVELTEVCGDPCLATSCFVGGWYATSYNYDVG